MYGIVEFSLYPIAIGAVIAQISHLVSTQIHHFLTTSKGPLASCEKPFLFHFCIANVRFIGGGRWRESEREEACVLFYILFAYKIPLHG